MKNIDVIKKFIAGGTSGGTKNLRIEGNRLMNYDTCIAEREVLPSHDEYVLNMTKYSSSTSTIQNAMLREFDSVMDVTVVEGVRIDTQHLIRQ